ncbi:D-alanine--D-alanine ligase [Acaryochloris sp. CCMEE 5410]|nr:D-alanine--D-alanine ligase [Acaryochloris sp. CCMEE 5410]
MKIGLLFDSQVELMAAPEAQVNTHYHWREPEEVAAVTQALTDLGHTVDAIGSLDNLLHRWQQQDLPDLVWNLSVGALSRNRTALAPALLEHLGIPYTGGDAATKSLTLNKDWLKPVLDWCNIATPPWRRFGLGESITELPPWPVSLLKPTCEGYSLGLQRFETQDGLAVLQKQVQQLQSQFQTAVICEPLIVGREITVGVVGNLEPSLLGAVETLTPSGQALQEQVLDLQAKRQGGFQKVNVSLADSDLQPLRSAAWKLMNLLQPLDYATFDFRLDQQRQAYLVDVNADATLHPLRSLAQIAQAQNLTYPHLIKRVLMTTCHRWSLSLTTP